MKLVKRNFEHYLKSETTVDLEHHDTYSIYSVYFVNGMVNPNYMSWIVNHIPMIASYSNTIYIVATIHESETLRFKEDIKHFFPTLNIVIEFHHKNEYEYRGILKAYELGQIHNSRNDLILYFHSKGVTHHKIFPRDFYDCVVKDIERVVEVFDIFPEIDKVGWSTGGIGWIWFNFWFVRGSCINTVEKPILTERRHYYEDWVSRTLDKDIEWSEIEKPYSCYKNTLKNCYGFYTDKVNVGNIGSRYDPSCNNYLDI